MDSGDRSYFHRKPRSTLNWIRSEKSRFAEKTLAVKRWKRLTFSANPHTNVFFSQKLLSYISQPTLNVLKLNRYVKILTGANILVSFFWHVQDINYLVPFLNKNCCAQWPMKKGQRLYSQNRICTGLSLKNNMMKRHHLFLLYLKFMKLFSFTCYKEMFGNAVCFLSKDVTFLQK